MGKHQISPPNSIHFKLHTYSNAPLILFVWLWSSNNEKEEALMLTNTSESCLSVWECICSHQGSRIKCKKAETSRVITCGGEITLIAQDKAKIPCFFCFFLNLSLVEIDNTSLLPCFPASLIWGKTTSILTQIEIKLHLIVVPECIRS